MRQDMPGPTGLHTTSLASPELPPAMIPKRIALFTGAYNHIADGVSLTLNRLVEHLEQNGAEVLVLAPTTEDPPIEHKGTLAAVPSIAAPGPPGVPAFATGFPVTPEAASEAVPPDPLPHCDTRIMLGLQSAPACPQLGDSGRGVVPHAFQQPTSSIIGWAPSRTCCGNTAGGSTGTVPRSTCPLSPWWMC